MSAARPRVRHCLICRSKYRCSMVASRYKRLLRRYWCCFICGSRKHIQEHHLGGRKHFRYFIIPLCQSHHQEVTIAIQRAGVNPSYTSDKTERQRRAVMHYSVFHWYMCEQVQQLYPERLRLLGLIGSAFHRYVFR